MTDLRAKLAAEEFKRRKDKKIPNVLQECLPYQLDFISNPEKRKSVCGTRRSAKSFMFALYLINQALTIPKSKCIYMGLTNESCKSIMWADIVDVIFDKYDIKAECDSKYEIKFDNGSVIFLRGLDATPHQMSRLRGNKFDIAVIDEIQDFSQDVSEIIDGVLKMSLAQTGATLCLGGTPSNKRGDNYWWTVNKPDSPLTQWKKFQFDWRNNTSIEPKSGLSVCAAIQADIDKDIKNNPLIVNETRFRQEVCGEWVIDSDKRVYKTKDYNYIQDLPANFLKGCTYILSIDLGYYDATAFVVGAYNKKFDNNLYIIESFKQSELTISAVADIIKEYKKKYNFTFHVVDAANAQAVEEMRQIHRLPLIAANKAGKEAHIALVNSDLTTNNIKIIRDANTDLIKELETLVWSQRALNIGQHKEDGTKENHLADSMLYCHNYSRHYWYRKPEEPIAPEEAMLQRIEKHFSPPTNKYIKTVWWEDPEQNGEYDV